MKYLCFLLVVFSIQSSSAQSPTIGTLLNTPESYDGYTLFTPIRSHNTFLINNCGQLVNEWQGDIRAGLSVYLLEDGTLLRTKRVNNLTFTAGGNGGGVQLFDWDSNLLWDYEVSSETECQHHDVEYLPNGNVLMIVWEAISQAEAIQAGRNPSNAPDNLWPEKIIEVEPEGATGGTVVWEWHAKDHLIQDFDSSKDNYGVVSEHPELIDINYPETNESDWLHMNSIDYNSSLDQIVLSVRATNELWVIDHSTSTIEAAGHTGGNSGKGGDLLYRWGNPEAYDRGASNDRAFYRQHDARWITEGDDVDKLIIFNNGDSQSRPYSTVDVIESPIDEFGNYTWPSNESSFLPESFYWTYEAPLNTNFYSTNISGAHRLPNNNTLICEGAQGHFFEVDEIGNIVWEYQNPIDLNGVMEQGEVSTQGVAIFRCKRYGADYSGFVGKDLTPGDVIELNSTAVCNLYQNPTSVVEQVESEITVIQNNSANYLTLLGLDKQSVLYVYDSYSRLMFTKEISGDRESISTSFWPTGIYIVSVSSKNDLITKKILIQ